MSGSGNEYNRMKLDPEIARSENALVVRDCSRMNSFRGIKLESRGVLDIPRWIGGSQQQEGSADAEEESGATFI